MSIVVYSKAVDGNVDCPRCWYNSARSENDNRPQLQCVTCNKLISSHKSLIDLEFDRTVYLFYRTETPAVLIASRPFVREEQCLLALLLLLKAKKKKPVVWDRKQEDENGL